MKCPICGRKRMFEYDSIFPWTTEYECRFCGTSLTIRFAPGTVVGEKEKDEYIVTTIT